MSPSTGLHPDFGTVWEGARDRHPLHRRAAAAQPKVPIHFTAYGDESDPGPYPVPPNAPVEGAGGPYADGDRHVLVLDADNQVLYELYHAYKQADGSWNAGSGAVFDLDDQRAAAGRLDVRRRRRAADPAGPRPLRRDRRRGRARPRAALHGVDDAARLRVPGDALRRRHGRPELPPMGLRVRLRADFDVSGFPPVVQTILRGLKKYGMMVADNGADWYVGGAPDSRWDDEALHALDGRDRRRLRGGRLARAAARRVLREPAGDGDARERAARGRAPAGSSTGPARSGRRRRTTLPAPGRSRCSWRPAATARAVPSRSATPGRTTGVAPCR